MDVSGDTVYVCVFKVTRSGVLRIRRSRASDAGVYWCIVATDRANLTLRFHSLDAALALAHQRLQLADRHDHVRRPFDHKRPQEIKKPEHFNVKCVNFAYFTVLRSHFVRRRLDHCRRVDRHCRSCSWLGCRRVGDLTCDLPVTYPPGSGGPRWDPGGTAPPKSLQDPPDLAVLLTHYGQLILGKFSQFDATRCRILRLKCTKIDFRSV